MPNTTYAPVAPSPPSLRDTSPQAGEELCPSDSEGSLRNLPLSLGCDTVVTGQMLSSLVRVMILKL